MKRIIIVLLVITSITAVSQESVLLRINYAKGDTYSIKIEQEQNIGLLGDTRMNITMDMRITEVQGEIFKTETKITSIVVDMLQGGISMHFDSNKKDEELDEKGQLLKSKLDPMMQATMYSSLDNLGNIIEFKIEPDILGMNELTGSAVSINYPVEKISIGSTWSSEGDREGIKTSTTFTVSNIANGIVYLDILGDVSGLGTGIVKGKTEIEISNGAQRNAEMEFDMSVQGIDMAVVSKTTITKD